MTSNYTLVWSRDMVRDGGIRRRWTHRLPWARPTSGWIVADAYGDVIGATPYLAFFPATRVPTRSLGRGRQR